MAQHPALLRDTELGAVRELAHLAGVVNQGGRHQEVGVQPGMELAGLEHERADRHRVLQQPAEVGVVAGTGAGSATELGGVRARQHQAGGHLAQPRLVDLAHQVLEEALELLDRAVGGGEEVGRVERARLEALDVVQLRHELVAEALDPAGDRDGIAGLEPQADPVHLAEDARGQRARPVAELEGEIRRAVAGGQPVLARAGEDALEALPGTQVSDRGTPGGGRLRRRGGCGCGRRVHASDCRRRPGRRPAGAAAGSLGAWQRST